MIRIAISVEAFDAIAATLPFGNVSFENKTDEKGQRLIWLSKRIDGRGHDLEDIVAVQLLKAGNSPSSREYSLVPYF